MLEKNYIVGLVDGEGSFTAYVFNPDKRTTRKRRARVEPKFYIKLIERDRCILYFLKKFFGCGNVYFQKDSRENHHNCYRYEVTKRDDLIKIIIPFFKKNPLRFPSKAKDFRFFCEIMEIIGRGEHLKNKGLNKLLAIKKKMH